MKSLIFSLAFLFSNLSLAANYTFKESHFSLAGSFKITDPEQAATPAFEIAGRTLLIEDTDNGEPPRAQVTIRRTTYDCDEVKYNYNEPNDYNCVLSGTKILQILDEVASRQEHYDDSIQVLKNYFVDYFYEKFSIPMGAIGQTGDLQTTTQFEDPTGSKTMVETKATTSGLEPL